MRRLSRLGQAGMTLVEIMVVVAIIGLILGVVGVNVFERFEKAKMETAATQIKALEGALAQYRRDNGSYPSTEQGLRALIEKPNIGKVPKYFPKSGYLRERNIPTDPWNNEYQYRSPGVYGNDFEIWSVGPDEDEGTEDDVKSWEMVE